MAVPVAAETSCREFRGEVDEVICAVTDENFYAVGQFYEDFSQTTDEEVRELLARSTRGTRKAVNKWLPLRIAGDVARAVV